VGYLEDFSQHRPVYGGWRSQRQNTCCAVLHLAIRRLLGNLPRPHLRHLRQLPRRPARNHTGTRGCPQHAHQVRQTLAGSSVLGGESTDRVDVRRVLGTQRRAAAPPGARRPPPAPPRGSGSAGRPRPSRSAAGRRRLPARCRPRRRRARPAALASRQAERAAPAFREMRDLRPRGIFVSPPRIQRQSKIPRTQPFSTAEMPAGIRADLARKSTAAPLCNVFKRINQMSPLGDMKVKFSNIDGISRICLRASKSPRTPPPPPRTWPEA
jgi:hypothetical protein